MIRPSARKKSPECTALAFWRRAAALALAGGLFLGLIGCEPKKEPVKRGRPPVPAAVAEAAAKDAPVIVSAIGAVRPFATASVKSRLTGHLKRIHFRSGDEVKAGQVLFTIDQAPFQLALEEARAILARDRAAAKQAEREFERYKALRKRGAVSPEQFEEKAVAASRARDVVKADLARVAVAKQNLAYCYIHAPITGRTGKRLIDEGNLVQANRDELVVINQLEPILVRFAVPEEHLADIRHYSAAGPLTVFATPPGRKGERAAGKLTFIDNQVNPDTGMIALEATFDNRDRRLWPGQFVTVKLQLTVEKAAVMVPFRAVMNGPQGFYVWVVKGDDTVEIRPVAKGRRLGDEVVITKGLKAGEKVVVDGQLRLYPGAKIVPAPSPDDKKPAGAKPAGTDAKKTGRG